MKKSISGSQIMTHKNKVLKFKQPQEQKSNRYQCATVTRRAKDMFPQQTIQEIMLSMAEISKNIDRYVFLKGSHQKEYFLIPISAAHPSFL